MVDAETIQDTSVHDLPLDKAGDRQTKERSAKAERGGGAARKTANGGGRDRKGARGNESAVVQLSKALSYILRHGTAKEGLQVRPDGYVPLDAVLARPRVSKIVMESGKPPAVDDVRQVVDSNDKKRFEMKQDEDGHWLIRAVQGHSLAQVTELDHIALTLDNLHMLADGEVAQGAKPSGPAQPKLPDGVEILHGTTREAWAKIETSGGLNRMKRNHIHLAKGRPNSSSVISGMRASSSVILHIDIISALRDGVPFQLASNGAVLTSGRGETGILPLDYVIRAEEGRTGATIWERGPRTGQ